MNYPYLNMLSKVTLGKVLLDNISDFEINENILEISDTAKITIPRNYKQLEGRSVLDQFSVGDKMTISAGYYYGADVDIALEFSGYIQEIESDYPLIIHCEDESYIFRQNNHNKSYRSATLKQVLSDIVPKDIAIECPDMALGKFMIDNASTYAVLQGLVKNYGLYSRLHGDRLKVGLAYEFGDNTTEHTYTIGKDVKKNELKYKRERDFKIRFKAISNNPDGTKTTVTVGNKDGDASERTLNFAGPMSEGELKKIAEATMKKVVYDGYTGSITGFGIPRTHAGDALVIRDQFDPEREGKYMIEKVDITYNETGGFSRKNSLSFKLQ
ncbi:hypothetical protein [Proteiniphilum sp.]|uniref:hypothetical protein n=1 Tax=Proteiniphilum sp. TaxID=1926877 RepID=UPI002B2191FA|nr:hypothetical protein [Proteiniphilum sp.]MEA4916543.1 hypothetical protein [Proteiniphilum sp.]MEA4948780.1 hypothetical protein [Petrimonas sp.]